MKRQPIVIDPKPNRSEETEVKVKDAMRTPVIKTGENITVDKVAKAMADNSVGSIVVVDKADNPVGIITERDIVRRVTVKNRLPSKVKSKSVMSHPLAIVSPELSLGDATKNMNKLGLRRLIVMDRGKLVGMLSSKEVLAVTPVLIDRITERAKVGLIIPQGNKLPLAGYCESCGEWSDVLVEGPMGRFLCEECVADMEKEE
jgi:signal-transduction protein with cAMP-binding, CBS, and nucleotidyltransferase domain